jgi:hypothetical protein
MTKPNYSRREFLQRSAGMAGASLVGGSILLAKTVCAGCCIRPQRGAWLSHGE